MFSLLKGIFSIILFIISSCFYCIVFIYKIIIFAFSFIKFILNNKKLRAPFIICVIGLLFKIKLPIIFTIYFLYLVNLFALSKGIYFIISNNIGSYLNNIKNNLSIKKLLKILPANNIVINNIFLENDEKTLNIYHLAITPNGLYNIVPLSSFLESYDNTNIDNNNVLYDIYNETESLKTTLSDIIEEDIPLTTIVLSSNASIPNVLETDTFKLAKEVELPYIINSTLKHTPPLDTNNIKELIFENKAWFLDILSIKFFNFIHKNKKVLLFFILCPLIYCLYMLILLLISNKLILVANNLSKLIIDFLKSFKL